MLSRSLCRLSKGVSNRFVNKGTAYTLSERKALGLTGTMPTVVETIEQQADRCWEQITSFSKPINRYQVLRNLLDTNATLFYNVVSRHLKETLPIIYTPTVGEACQKYSDLFTKDHALYLSTANIGNVREALKNMSIPDVDVIVITDGSRILGLGDLGVNGVGISIGKTSLYVAAGGVDPSRVLPVVLDVGTNTDAIRSNPHYIGVRERRCSDEQFYGLLDEFMDAVKEEWPSAVVQFEDFSSNHCFDMLARYQNKYRCFNDDIQGTGAVISAGFLTALKLSSVPPEKQRILFFGAGSAATGVADSIVALTAAHFGMQEDAVRKQCYFVDSKGLLTNNRGDGETMLKHKKPWARTDIPEADNAKLRSLLESVKYVKPTALIGLGATGGAFNEEIVRFMTTYCEDPIIFPLSNPSSRAEVLPENAYKWTNGKAIVASGSPFGAVQLNGKTLAPSQGNNLYIFPGVGLGCAIAQPPYIPQEVLVASARCLSSLVTKEDLSRGQLYPAIDNVKDVSADVAVACIQQLQKMGLAKADLPKDAAALKKLTVSRMWKPEYKSE